jgi:hypothetical protein
MASAGPFPHFVQAISLIRNMCYAYSQTQELSPGVLSERLKTFSAWLKEGKGFFYLDSL